MNQLTKRILIFISGILFFAVSFQNVQAQTYVDYFECQKGKPIIWHPKGNPYIIRLNVELPPDCRLIILPGVQVITEHPNILTIRGTLQVLGGRGNPVHFTSDIPDYYNANNLEPFKYMNTGEDTSQLCIENGKASFKHVVFDYLQYAIRGYDSIIDVNNCTFSNNFFRVIWLQRSDLSMTESIITGTMPFGLIEQKGEAIDVSNWDNSDPRTVEIVDNRIVSNHPTQNPDIRFNGISLGGNLIFNIIGNTLSDQPMAHGLNFDGIEQDGICFIPDGKIVNNTMIGPTHIGIHIYNEGDPKIILDFLEQRPLLIQDNDLYLGPAIQAWYSNVNIISNCIKFHSQLASGNGCGIVLKQFSKASIIGNSILHYENGVRFEDHVSLFAELNEISENNVGFSGDSWIDAIVQKNNIDNINGNIQIGNCDENVLVPNNWWGTTDPDVIINKIHSHCTPERLREIILYQPIAFAPFIIECDK